MRFESSRGRAAASIAAIAPHSALLQVDHRPWPLPSEPWAWRQSWLDLAFLHYPVAAEALRRRLPSGLELDTFDGTAWVGVVPFRMAGVMRRPLPDLPGFASFAELNVRTYVTAGGKPGVWFFSLDASFLPVVWGGRILYRLPYHHARMRQEWRGEAWDFSSVRRAGAAQFVARYRPAGAPFLARAGTFEHWATERYCLYSLGGRTGLARVEVHHAPWPLQPAEATVEENTLLAAAGLEPTTKTPRGLFSRGVHVVSFRPHAVR